MYKDHTVAVVVPAYNEELLIGRVIETMPVFVDAMIIVDDCSSDRTNEIIRKYQEADPRVQLLTHETNRGLGQTLIDGYHAAYAAGYEIIAVMAGDAQMSPDDLPAIVDPIATGHAHYTKGNRLLRDEVIDRMPRYRFLGNSLLTLLTKFATGYWHIIDPQCGYTAISRAALGRIPIDEMTKGYGYNADILNMLNLQNMPVADVEVEPIYGEEQSKIKLGRYTVNTSLLLLRLFRKRLWRKYLVRQFHPLVFFYLFFLVSSLFLALPLSVRFFVFFLREGVVPATTLILLTFTSTMAFFSLFFAMWLDMEDNRRLVPTPVVAHE
jgi:glycosyltransferase involved in cell wall biosynthesis